MRKYKLLPSIILFAVSLAQAQTPAFTSLKPDRGSMPYGSLAASDFDSVDLSSGGVNLRIPLAQLPPGRGGFSHSLALSYSSQIYNLTTDTGSPSNVVCPGACPAFVNVLEPSLNFGAGWRYSYSYRLLAERRPGNGPVCGSFPDPETSRNLWRYSLIFPDGSSHLLTLNAALPGTPDGYYPYSPTGSGNCSDIAATPLPMRFYTTDGTFVQLTLGEFTWDAIFPDRTRVSGSSVNGFLSVASSICDRNANCVQISNFADSNGLALTEIVDAFNRRIRIRYTTVNFAACPQPTDCDSSADEILQPGFGTGNPTDPAAGVRNQWTVRWGNSAVGGGNTPLTYPCRNPDPNDQNTSYTCVLNTQFRNVTSIELPTDSQNLRYQFCYADNSAPAALRGYGELLTAALPNGTSTALACGTPSSHTPRIEYRWQFNASAGRTSPFTSENPLSTKTLHRQENLAGNTNVRAETWSYAFPSPGVNLGSVTAPDGGTTNHVFSNLGGLSRVLTKTTSPNGAVVEKLWALNEPWIGVSASDDRKNPYIRTELRRPSGTSSDSATTYTYDKNGNLRFQREFAAGVTRPSSPAVAPSGTVLRETEHNYHFTTPNADAAMAGTRCPSNFANAYWGCNPGLEYRSAKLRTTVREAGTPVSATEFQYDNPATTANLINEFRWDDTRSASLPALSNTNQVVLTSANAEQTSYAWAGGNLTSVITPDGDQTTYSYNSPTTTCPADMNAVTNLFPRQITQHSNQGSFAVRTDYTYDCATGLPTVITSYAGTSSKAISDIRTYDRFGRLTGSTIRTGSTDRYQTARVYEDVAFRITDQSSQVSATDLNSATVTYFNPTGLVQRTQANDDIGSRISPNAAGGIVTDSGYIYFSASRYELESAPYRPAPELEVVQPPQTVPQPPRTWIRRRFDQDGRLREVDTLTRNGSALPFPWVGGSPNTDRLSSQTWTYNGYSVTITDAASRSRTETRDALGRLTAVAQSGVATTSYSYPAKQFVVTQSDPTNHPNTAAQTRTFSYSSLGRLLSAGNPESGLTTYTYRLGGLLNVRADARGQSVTHTYDAAQRLLTKTYSATTPPTPNVSYCYGGQIFSGSSCTADISGRSTDLSDFPTDRLTGYGSSVAATNLLRIDALGRPTRVQQRIQGAPDREFSYSHGSGGALLSMTYPSGRVITYTLSNAGRPVQASGLFGAPAASTTYVSNLKYTPTGAPSRWNVAGPLITETRTFNALGQTTQIEAVRGPTLLHRLGYTYGAGETNNGNILSQTIESVQGTWTQRYGYDDANRLRVAAEVPELSTSTTNPSNCAAVTGFLWTRGNWCEGFGFDGYGNIWASEQLGGIIPPLPANGSAWYRQGNIVANRYAGVNYDAAGNQTQLQVNDPAVVTDYDAEGRLVQRRNASNQVMFSYLYDGEGRRVQADRQTDVTYFYYGPDGELAAEYSNFKPGFLGAGGGRATPDYLFTDALGSVRTKTNGTGFLTARFDYEPYGQELPRNGSGSDSNRLRFTGKERDAEAGLDFFESRYFSSAQGRFTSPDVMMGKPEWLVDPQRWNRYAYVRNNPLKYIDPNGEDLVVYYSLGRDLSEADREWFNKNKASILAGIQAKFEKAGVQNVSFRDQATLSKKQLAQLDNGSPLGVSRLTFVGKDYPGLGQAPLMGVLGYAHPDGKRIAGVFLDTFPKVSAIGCDQACIAGNVAAHELGHTIGIPHLGFMEEMADRWRQRPGWLGGTETRPDLMTGSMGVPTQPLYFKPGTNERTQRAIEQLNRIGDMTPKR